MSFLARAIPHTLSDIPSGDAGIRATLKVMRRMVLAARVDPAVRQVAQQLTNALPPKAYGKEVTALFNFVRDRIRYVQDVRDVETLQTPQRTLIIKSGDCDDKSMLIATLLESIGHKTLFKAVGVRGQSLSHVYVQTMLGNKWISLDCTMRYPAGWEPPDVTDTMIQHI